MKQRGEKISALTAYDFLMAELLDQSGIAVILVGMFVVVRFIQKVVTKLVIFAVLAALGLSLWVQREELSNCARECKCTLYGREVQIPASQIREIPQSERIPGCVIDADGNVVQR